MEQTENRTVDYVQIYVTPNIDKVKDIVESMFPGLWFYVEAELAALATLFIDDIKDPASIILEGPASCGKGTTLSAMKELDISYWTDDFTSAALVSQAANKTEKKLNEIDLLPKIENNALIVPEMSARARFMKNIGIGFGMIGIQA